MIFKIKPAMYLTREELEVKLNFHRWLWGMIAYFVVFFAFLLLLDYLWVGEFYFS